MATASSRFSHVKEGYETIEHRGSSFTWKAKHKKSNSQVAEGETLKMGIYKLLLMIIDALIWASMPDSHL